MPADYGQERFAPLPDEPAAVPQAPPPAPAPSDAPPAPVGLYGQAKAGRAPVSDRLGPFARADVDAYALKHGLTTEQAFTILMARKRGER